MAKVYYDRVFEVLEYDVDLNSDIFKQILNIKRIDEQRFFLMHISSEDLSRYDFDNKKSFMRFRDDRCSSITDPVKRMGGCNMTPEALKKGIRDGGIALSDPNKVIRGQFDVMGKDMIYSPIFPFFYEERDLIKFANETIFTDIPFRELVINQMRFARRFLVHIRNRRFKEKPLEQGESISESGEIFKEIDKDEMMDYLTDPEKGEAVLRKYLGY